MIAVLSLLGAVAMLWAVTRPPFRLRMSQVRTAYWQVWVGDHYQHHALPAKTEAAVVRWLDDATKAPLTASPGCDRHGACRCQFVQTANAVLGEVSGNLITVENVLRCGMPSTQRAYVSVTVDSRRGDLGTYPYVAPPLVKWLLSLPRQPQSVVCGAWSDAPPLAPPGSIGEYLSNHYGIVRQCDLHGRVWVISTYAQHGGNGAVAIFACAPGDHRCFNGAEPHRLSGWRIYPAPVGGTVVIDAFPSANCVSLTLGAAHLFFNLSTRRFARACR